MKFEERFVPFQLVLKLKEKGFIQDLNDHNSSEEIDFEINELYTPAPTWKEVFDWFKKKYDLVVYFYTDKSYSISLDSYEYTKKGYFKNKFKSKLDCLNKLIELTNQTSCKTMKAKIMLITPAYAEELLKKNSANRKLKDDRVNFYYQQMKTGLWKENGEPIIIDTKGVVKDGQHRLYAVIKAKYSYTCPIIYDVSTDVMDTIDTGSNRSLSDVLSLNGFHQPSRVASVVRVALLHDRESIVSNHSVVPLHLPNSKGLEWALKNRLRLVEFVKNISKMYGRQTTNLLSVSELSWYAYAIDGLLVTPETCDFLESVITGNKGDTSCTYYGYKKLLHAKNSKVTINNVFKFNMVLKLWGVYQNDSPVYKLIIDNDKLLTLKDVIK